MNKNILSKTFVFALITISLLQISGSAGEAINANVVKHKHKICQKDNQNENQKRNQKKKQMEKVTSFTYHQTGGFAAVNKTYSVKLADMSKEDREKLETLISNSGLLSMSKEKKTTPGAADMFFYEFTADNGGEHSATYDDGQLPDAFRPLVEFARARTTSSR